MGLRKKPNHYKQSEKKKDTREVLSFEDLPLDEYEKKYEGKVKLSRKKIIAAVAVVLVLVIAVSLYFGQGAITSCINRNSEGISVPVSGLEAQPGNFALFSDGFCYASDTVFNYVSTKGEQLYTLQHAYSEPMLETTVNAAILYDLGAKGFTITDDNKAVYTGQAEENIYLADVTTDFSYALVTQTSGYNAKLYAYNPSHELKFAYSFSEYYITSMALNSDATGAVVCGVSADKGTGVSAIYVLDFTKEEPVAKHIVQDETIYDCEYLTNTSICAVGLSSSYICKGKNFSNITEKSYNQMTLTTYDINTDTGVLALSLSRSGDGRNCNIEYINSSSKTEKIIETELQILSISTYKDRIAVTDRDTVYLYKRNGDLTATQTVTADCQQVRMFNISGVYVLGMSDIKIYNL